MYRPTLGGYPLVLRDYNVDNLHNGELSYDYDKDELYYKNKGTGENKSVAKSIYDQIIAARLENTRIKITKTDIDPSATEPELPEVADRRMNTFYINIESRNTRSSDDE